MAYARSFRIYLFGLALGGLFILSLVAGPARSQAATEPFKIVFDKDKVKIGLINELPVGATTAGGSIEGTVDDAGNVEIPPEGFKFPIYGISDPLSVQAYMATSKPVTGTWDKSTGQLVLDAKVGIFLKINVTDTLNALSGLGLDLGGSLGSLGSLAGLLSGDLACGFSPMDVTFTTESEGGSRFTKGTLGPGAVVANWAQLGKFAGQEGVGSGLTGSTFACPLIKSLAPTLLQSVLGGVLPEGIDLGGLDIASILNNLDNVNLGPSSLTLTRTKDESVATVDPPVVVKDSGKPNLKISVKSSKKKIKAGKKAEFTVKVKNSGDADATGVKVCIESSGPIKVQGKYCRTLGKVMAGATQTRRFKVKAKKGKKSRSVKVSFDLRSINADDSSAGTRILIGR